MEHVLEGEKWRFVCSLVNTVLGKNDSPCKVISSGKMRAGMRGDLTLRFDGLADEWTRDSESRPVDRHKRGREASELGLKRKSANKGGDSDRGC